MTPPIETLVTSYDLIARHLDLWPISDGFGVVAKDPVVSAVLYSSFHPHPSMSSEFHEQGTTPAAWGLDICCVFLRSVCSSAVRSMANALLHT
jgi:hypothetical protein